MRLFFIIVLLTVATGSFAQTIGIKAGINFSYMKVENDYYGNYAATHKTKYDMKTGFNAGLTSELPVNNKFSINAGILLSTKGYTMSTTDIFAQHLGLKYESTGTVNLIYLDIPLEAKVYLNTGSAKTYVAFGPYIGIGLVHNYGGGTKNSFEGLNRMDYGLIPEAGIEIHSLQLSLSYTYGLVNISTDNHTIIKNRVLGISLGYKFGV